MKLNKLAILGAKTLKTQTVNVPEWGEGGEVTIRELNAGEAQALGVKAKENEAEGMVLWVIAGVLDEDGNRMFSDLDKAALNELSAAAVLRVGNAMVKLCGFAAEETKETEKN